MSLYVERNFRTKMRDQRDYYIARLYGDGDGCSASGYCVCRRKRHMSPIGSDQRKHSRALSVVKHSYAWFFYRNDCRNNYEL